MPELPPLAAEIERLKKELAQRDAEIERLQLEVENLRALCSTKCIAEAGGLPTPPRYPIAGRLRATAVNCKTICSSFVRLATSRNGTNGS